MTTMLTGLSDAIRIEDPSVQSRYGPTIVEAANHVGRAL